MGKERPTVCQVLHSLHVGGAEVLAARLARRLRDDYRFVFACLDGVGTLGDQLLDEGFPVVRLGRRPGVDWRCSRGLARLLRRERVDVVHAHQYAPFFYSLAARLLRRRPSVLFTEHGRAHPDRPSRKRLVANRLLLRRGDRVVGVGEAVRRALIANEGFPARRVEVIYNGIDLTPFERPAPDRAGVRAEMGVGPDDFVVLQVARLDPVKDHATAVRAAARLSRRHPNARLVVVGEGEQMEAIRDAVRRNEAGDVVRLLGLRTDVPRLLGAADAFLLSSVTEGIPLTLIEAMAARLPVVSTNVGGVAEVVEDGKTGLLAAAGDDADLAEHLARLAGDTALRHSLGRAGRARALAVFSEVQMHAQYDRLYREMLPAAANRGLVRAKDRSDRLALESSLATGGES